MFHLDHPKVLGGGGISLGGDGKAAALLMPSYGINLQTCIEGRQHAKLASTDVEKPLPLAERACLIQVASGLLATRRIEVAKCLGEENMADLLTKAVSVRVLNKLLAMCGLSPTKTKEVGALHQGQIDKKWAYGLIGMLQLVCSRAATEKKHEDNSITSWMWFAVIVLSAFSWWIYWAWRVFRWCTASRARTVPQGPAAGPWLRPPVPTRPTRTTFTQTGFGASLVDGTVYLTDSNTAQGTFHLTRNCGHLIHARRVISRAVCADCDALLM